MFMNPVHQKECPECHGRGTILLLVTRAPCDRCNGTGSLTEALDPDRPIGDALYMSQRVRTHLHCIGATSLRDAAGYTEDELSRVKGLDRESVTLIKILLRRCGLALRGAPAPLPVRPQRRC
jgi:DNA-directed RNA polymerase alpha subunit